MKLWLIRKWLRFEYSSHMVDAYLAQMRCDWKVMAEYQCRAYDCQRQLDRLAINARYAT